MYVSEIEEYYTEVQRQLRDEDYIRRFWNMVSTCLLLAPKLKEGVTVTPEDFIGKPPWEEEQAVVAKSEESDEELIAIAVSKGLRGPNNES
jgi:hypothetical protein